MKEYNNLGLKINFCFLYDFNFFTSSEHLVRTMNPLLSSSKFRLLFLTVVIIPFWSQKFLPTHLKIKTIKLTINPAVRIENYLVFKGHWVIRTWGRDLVAACLPAMNMSYLVTWDFGGNWILKIFLGPINWSLWALSSGNILSQNCANLRKFRKFLPE